jgi:cation diffusion facilitator family transporter
VNRASLTRYAWISIVASLVTMGMKVVAWRITGSVGLLSDAVESIVNLIGGVMALTMLTVAARPSDKDHAFGHSKAEYFSSGVEGTFILVAAFGISLAAVQRLLNPQHLQELGIGLLVSILAALVNLGVALLLLRVGRRYSSITLEANAHHLLTDVWTSGGIVVGIGIVALTGWEILDPLVAIAVAANIVWVGSRIVRRSVDGLMDKSLTPAEVATVQAVLKTFESEGALFHALRTRQAGARKFISLHVLVPGAWTVQRGHDLLERVERTISAALPGSVAFTHLEPVEDPRAWARDPLDLED